MKAHTIIFDYVLVIVCVLCFFKMVSCAEKLEVKRCQTESKAESKAESKVENGN